MSADNRQFLRGQALVEFALVLILLMPIILVIVDLGRAVYYYSVVYNAAREGARAGIIPNTYALEWDIRPIAIRDAVLSKAIGVEINSNLSCVDPYYHRPDPDNNLAVDNPTCDIYIEGPNVIGSDALRVSVRTRFVPVTPYIEQLLGLDPGDPLEIWGKATMVVEK